MCEKLKRLEKIAKNKQYFRMSSKRVSPSGHFLFNRNFLFPFCWRIFSSFILKRFPNTMMYLFNFMARFPSASQVLSTNKAKRSSFFVVYLKVSHFEWGKKQGKIAIFRGRKNGVNAINRKQLLASDWIERKKER